jgi:Co/Zn/Cd efflux system component
MAIKTHLPKNPIVFGTLIGIAVIIFNISIISLAEGSLKNGYEAFLSNGIFIYLIPLAVGTQMGLFRHHKNITREFNLCDSEKIGLSGSITSSLTMAACCLHHVTDLLPAIGLLAATTTFLTQYRDVIIAIGLSVNIIGSALLIKEIISYNNINSTANAIKQ